MRDDVEFKIVRVSVLGPIWRWAVRLKIDHHMNQAYTLVNRMKAQPVLRGNPYLTRDLERHISAATWAAHELR